MAGSLKDPLLSGERGGNRDESDRVFEGLLGRRNYGREKLREEQVGNKEEADETEATGLFSRASASVLHFFTRFKQELNSATLPLKAGVAAALCSVLCFIPGPLDFLNKNGMWAVVTADLVLEANVGLTFSKGINRTLGTLVAATLALLVNFTAPKCGQYEPVFVVFFVFLGGALPTMFKFRRPFKDRWNYAVAMSMVTFHILILSQTEYKDKIRLPLIRLLNIVIGFFIASLVNLIFVPTYAGSTIHELVGKNFERAGNVMERCVTAYCEGTVLEQVPNILSGKSEDDNIHMSFHEIVSSDSEVDKLLKAVPFEPCHGKFFFGFPWDMYEDITDNLRYTLYDVVALDSCLRAEIQAPLHLRHIFQEEFQCIGKECAQVFRLIGESIKAMRHVRFGQPMRQAEEGALLLQHKIAKYTSTLIGGDCNGAHWDKMKDIFEENDSSHFHDKLDMGEHIDSANDTVQSKSKTHLVDGNESFLKRQTSIAQHWDTTVQRISAVSLIKFASLLIELVAKAKYVVTIVDELEISAHFEEEPSNSSASTPKRGYQQV